MTPEVRALVEAAKMSQCQDKNCRACNPAQDSHEECCHMEKESLRSEVAALKGAIAVQRMTLEQELSSLRALIAAKDKKDGAIIVAIDEGNPSWAKALLIQRIGLTSSSVPAAPSVEDDPFDICECDHTRSAHPVVDCEGCFGCKEFRLRDRAQKEESK